MQMILFVDFFLAEVKSNDGHPGLHFFPFEQQIFQTHLLTPLYVFVIVISHRGLSNMLRKNKGIGRYPSIDTICDVWIRKGLTLSNVVFKTTMFCLISMDYHLEVRNAIAFYLEYHFLPKQRKLLVCTPRNMTELGEKAIATGNSKW